MEHESGRESHDVAADLFVETLHRHAIQFCQITVKHDLYTTNGKYATSNLVWRNILRDCLNFILHTAPLSPHQTLQGCPRSTRLATRAEAAEYFGETWRKVLEKILAALADVIPRADIVPAHNSITPGACSRGALRTDLLHDWTPIPFVVSDALRGRTTAAGYNTPTAHFRNRRCLAECRRRLGRAFALKPAEEASSITFQIGRRGSRHQHPLPDRPPALQAFRSVLSRAPSVSTQRLSRLPFVPPSPRSSIPGSSNIIPKIQL